MLMADARDTYATMAIAVLAAVVALAPFAALTWDLDAAALPFVVGSAAFELAYLALLAHAYARSGLTAIYPIARGAAPVIVLLVSVALLSAHVSRLQALGVLVVGAGVLLVRGWRRPEREAVPLALGVAACIAGYTLIDDRGLEHASPVPYFEAVLVLTVPPYVAFVVSRRGLGALRAAASWRAAAIGIGMVSAYLLALAALERAEAAPVAALRETSVVMAALAAALAGRERVPPARLAGAVAVVTGVAAIALG
jgi:drug/metabolite transporter (DMT)-like permease